MTEVRASQGSQPVVASLVRQSIERRKVWKLADECGLKINLMPDEKCILFVDPVIFIRKLDRRFRQDPDSRLKADFLEELDELVLGDTQTFLAALMPTEVSPDAKDLVQEARDSFLRLLVRVESIQPRLAELLFGKLSEYCQDASLCPAGVDVLRLIIGLFRFLDVIADSKIICEKIFAVMPQAELGIQRDLVSIIPEVATDDQHEPVGLQLKWPMTTESALDIAQIIISTYSQRLVSSNKTCTNRASTGKSTIRDLMLSNQQLLASVVDTFNYLSLGPEVLAEIRESVFSQLPSIEAQHIPVILNFFLTSAIRANAQEVIRDIRVNVDLHSIFGEALRAGRSSQISSGNNLELVTVEMLHNGVVYRKHILDAVFKVVESLSSKEDLTMFDVLLLLIAFDSSKKKVVALLRKKIPQEKLTDQLISACFTHDVMVKRFLKAWLELASSFLRSPEPQVVRAGRKIYEECFSNSDDFDQFEIVGSILEHIGSASDTEIDAALATLAELTSSQADTISNFASLIQNTVDTFPCLSLAQVKRVFTVLVRIAFNSNGGNSPIQNELHMLVEKYIISSVPRLISIGVSGGLMIVHALCSGGNQRSQQAKEKLKEAMDLNAFLVKHTKAKSSARALYCDELADIVKETVLHPLLQENISDSTMNLFQEECLVETEAAISEKIAIAWEKCFDLDKADEASLIMIPILCNLVTESSRETKDFQLSTEKLNLLCPIFRLLQQCEYRKTGNFDGIDAILGAPLILCKKHLLEEPTLINSPKAKRMVTLCAFYACNWMRELLNAFTISEDPVLQGKVLKRLYELLYLHDAFEKCVNVPPVDFQHVDERDVVFGQAVASGKPSSKSKSKSKKDKASKKRSKKSTKGAKNAKRKKKALADTAEETGDDAVDPDLPGTSRTAAGIESAAPAAQIDSKEEDDDEDVEAAAKADNEGPEEEPGEIAPGTQQILFDSAKHFFVFREIDIVVANLLKYPVSTSTDEEVAEVGEDGTHKLSVTALVFLLDDLHRKVKHKLSPAARGFGGGDPSVAGNKNAGFQHLAHLSEAEFAKAVAVLVPFIKVHLDKYGEYFKALTDSRDPEQIILWTSTSLGFANALFSMLSLLSIFFSWRGFKSSENKKIVSMCLQVFGDQRADRELEELADDAVAYFLELADVISSVRQAAVLLKVMLALSRFNPHSLAIQPKIAQIAQGFLKREWLAYDKSLMVDRGAAFNEAVKFMLKTFLDSGDAESQLKDLEVIIQTGLSDATGNESLVSETFQTLTKHTFAIYFGAILEQLCCVAKSTGSFPKNGDSAEISGRFEVWVKLVRCYNSIVGLTKKFATPTVLMACLRTGRVFIDLLIRNCLPLVDHIFHDQFADVQVLRHAALSRHVPANRKTLEALVLRVKAAFAFNKCQCAFSVGILKNRNLQGEEILSQRMPETEEEDEDNDENQEGDDDSVHGNDPASDAVEDADNSDANDDVINLNDSNAASEQAEDRSGNADSYSEVF